MRSSRITLLLSVLIGTVALVGISISMVRANPEKTHPLQDCDTIYDIQYVSDPGTDDASPCAGQTVTIDGIVNASFSSGYFIADATGPWNGIYVYDNSQPTVGDEVEITGEVSEYYNLTEIKNLSDYTVLSSGNTPYGPSVVTADDIAFDDMATSEAYEGVFVEVHNIMVEEGVDSHGIWTFTDTSAGKGKVDDWGYRLEPDVGETYAIVRGPLIYDWSEYKIIPRTAEDIMDDRPIFSKSAPVSVNPGDLFTYTLNVENELGFDLHTVTITDTVPSSSTFAYGLDGGMESGGVVSWTVNSISNGTSSKVRFVVTATGNLGDVIANNDYAVRAANFVTPTFGSPVRTIIGKPHIYHIQGDGTISPFLGKEVTTEGVVVADFQADDELNGFFMQDATGDGDNLTSDGIFVYATQVVSEGDWVEVTGTVAEDNDLTKISPVSNVSVISTGNTIPATQVTFPETVDGEIERYEGMLVTIPHTMTVAQNYFQGRYGQVTLSTDGRMYQPTHMYEPGSAEYEALLDENMRRMLILDDGSSDENPNPIPYIGLGNTLRAGDVVSANLTGIIDNGPINSGDLIDYRLHPTEEVEIERTNSRSASPPDVGGRLQVASFNVLNYFNGDGMGGGFPTSRGADTPEEFERQRAKIITAVLALDADVVGLMEIENDGYGPYSAIADLVDGLNEIAGAGTYAYIDPGITQIGDDEIAVGLIYKPGSVTPIGNAAILDSTFDPDYIDTKNRPALAQTFDENATGARFTAVVNHLKSKGYPCDSIGDPDEGDGQGNCNLTRTSAMSVEVSWLGTDPTESGDLDYIILGDLNSYAQEDPIDVARNAGYTDLLWQKVGSEAYSYIFDGQSGYLDYALSNSNLTPQVTGATVWHINTDEPSIIDYNTEFKSEDLYTTSAYRASDHDPVLIGLDLLSANFALTKNVTPTVDVVPGDALTYTLSISNGGSMDGENVLVVDTLPKSVTFGDFITADGALENTNTITWTGNISSGKEVNIVFTATLNQEPGIYNSTVENQVTYKSNNVGTGNASVTFTTIGPPALELTKAVTPETNINFGDVVTYTLTLTNSGAATAYNIALTDTLPSELTGDDFMWTGDLPASDDIDFVHTATLAMDTTIYGEIITNTATYTSDNANSGQAEASFTVIGPPDLETSAKSSSHAGQNIMPSDFITYTITLSNTGDVATIVMLTDTIGSYYNIADSLDFNEAANNTLTWTGSISAESEMTLQFSAQVVPMKNLDIGMTMLENSITIDDNINAPFDISDQNPPYVKIEGVYLPIVTRNSS